MAHKEQNILSVRNLEVCFRSHNSVARAVEGVTFDVGAGETVCLVGESGCGKTVSALSILGLVPQPPGDIVGGEVFFMGQNLLVLKDEDLQALRGNRVAMVFQEPMTSLNPVFTIGDQIAEAITAHEDVSASKVMRRCVRLLADVGIAEPEERLRDYPHQLSGGQRQRVMIAMALACNPELVIADEPTTALDVTVQAQILKLFSDIQHNRGMSLLYITHDLGVVANIADRIYVMYAGIVVEQGTTKNIFDAPNHPYTKGLLASLPVRSKRGTSLKSIPGAVPDPAFKPSGCPFHPRCFAAKSSCRSDFPEMCHLGGAHWSRCPIMCGNGI
jgi:peptide/nickel transport system ATP-binding protein/oligopeptide transport system ATP-binding protein